MTLYRILTLMPTHILSVFVHYANQYKKSIKKYNNQLNREHLFIFRFYTNFMENIHVYLLHLHCKNVNTTSLTNPKM